LKRKRKRERERERRKRREIRREKIYKGSGRMITEREDNRTERRTNLVV
jgi:hypothetical protein